MLRLLIALAACSFASAAFAQGTGWGVVTQSSGAISDPVSGLLPVDRDFYANWSKAGLLTVGGIPTSSTQCGSTLTPSGGDDTSAINSAISACSVSSCPSGKYINFGSGTFLINGAGVPVQLNKCVVLRGQGPGTTILHSSNGAVLNNDANGTHSAAIVSAGGSGSITETTNLSADAAQGSYTIQVTSATGFVVGGLVLVDEQANGQSMPDCCFNSGTGHVWAEPDYRVMWNNHSPAVDFYDSACVGFSNGNNWSLSCETNSDECAYSVRCGGVNEELHLITAVNGTTITFDSPLTLSYRTANTAQAHLYPAASIVKYAGVENMTLSNGDEGNLVFSACMYCWAYKVESTQWLNAGGFAFYSAAFRDQVELSYVHNAAWPVNGGGGYAVNSTYGSSENLFWNNIDMLANKVDVVRASGSGTVFAYNYMDDGYINGQDGWVETGLNCSHLAGSHGCLFEGNLTWNSDNDVTHGNVGHIAFFRNQMTGLRAPFTALDGTSVDDTSGCCGPLRAVGDHFMSYWDSFVGNVAGRSGFSYSAWTDRCEAGNADTGCAPSMFNLGWNDTSVSGSLGDATMNVSYPGSISGTITGAAGTFATNPAPIVDGNYDYKTSAIQWASNDSAHTLPNSFFLTSAPAFFSAGAACTYSWPWVTPTSGTPIQSAGGSGCSSYSALPAMARFQAGTPFVQP